MDDKTVSLDAKQAKDFISEAKDILSASRIPKNARLTADESQRVWWLLDQAEARVDALFTVSMLRDKN